MEFLKRFCNRSKNSSKSSSQDTTNKHPYEKILDDYIEYQNNYALMISGEWGSGKTYFIDKYKKDRIEKYAEEKTIFIMISLFGIQNINTIFDEILFEIYPILKNKTLKPTIKLIKIISRAIFQYKLGNDFDLDRYLNDIPKVDSKNLIGSHKIVLCLDDLERKSPEVSYQAILGTINTLINDPNFRIIIIANEKELKEEETYINFKEKLIGVTIPFEPNVTETITAIVDSFSSYPKFQKWLDNQKAIIEKALIASETLNFRNIIFGITKIHQIYSQIETCKLEEEIRQSIEKNWDKILYFSICVSIEFRNKKFDIDDEKFNSLTSRSIPLAGELIGGNKNLYSNDNYINQFNTKYFGHDSTYNFPAITDFICIKSPELNIDYFIKNIKLNFPNNKYHEAQILLSELNPRRCDLEDSEFHYKFNQLRKNVYEGIYKFQDLLYAFALFIYYKDLLNIDIQEEFSKFKNAINLHTNNNIGNLEIIHDPHSILHLDFIPIESKEKFEQLIEICEEAYKYSDEQIQQNLSKNLEYLLLNDFELFLKNLHNMTHSPFKEAILAKINQNELYNMLELSTNKQLRLFHNIISVRFSERNKKYYENEKESIKEFLGLLQRNLKSNTRFSDQIKIEIIEVLNSFVQ